MRFCQRGRDRDGFLSIAPRFGICCRALAGKVTNNSPRLGTLCVSQGIIRIELDCTIEISNGFTIILDIATLEMEMGLIPPVYVTSFRLFTAVGPLARIWRTPLSSKRVHCFEALADLPASSRFSPLVSQAEYDALQALK